jgi:hypothetical protein
MAKEPTSGLSMMKPRAAKPAVTEETEEKQGKYPEVSLPPDYSPPDDAAEGDTWDATVKFKSKGPGKACLVSVDGVPYEEEAEEEEEEPAKSPSLAEAAAAQRMKPGYAGAM